MTDFTGSGDARRTMELLWGATRPSGRGPRPKLNLDQIVDTAIELADAGGLGAISMRNVAEQLGAAPMALYTYVPSKAELLDIVVDRVHAELPTDIDAEPGWRSACELFLRATWELYERHPWMLQLACSRSPLGPNEVAAYEANLRLLEGLGLSAVEQVRAVGMMASFVRGVAKAVSDARAAEYATGQTDEQWWAERSPLLDEMVGDWNARFPVLARLDAKGAFDQLDRAPDDATPYSVREELDVFEFGLQRLLDGLEAFIARRPSPSPPPG